MAELIWEEYGMTLDEYAKAFNKALDKAFIRELEDKVYLVNFVDFVDNEPRVTKVVNIGE